LLIKLIGLKQGLKYIRRWSLCPAMCLRIAKQRPANELNNITLRDT
jgi:hypothetical protein